MEGNTSFLGTGWAFPPEFNKEGKESGKVEMLSDEVDIKSSLEILLSTRLGERVMVPNYGCNLDELLFKPLNLTLKTFVKELIKNAILYYEPRIDVEKIQIDQTNELDGELLILIDYRIRVTNARNNLVFPFYKEEGTNI
ncbi:GPW/gp25 family protein [Aquimarina sp. 2201CG14-23]|uniref:GPW/gp25 family protein n=1 Tax=Aquimarina mycalae TaxID=3040073 RepID=UPI0024780CC1|nr:GPW/gp25 family protein [Aquimarina sp. 2201CG14-23]MDH7444138.1 GPW/gp25 family protein [Aquimarina sp. 2201CG14-23]